MFSESIQALKFLIYEPVKTSFRQQRLSSLGESAVGVLKLGHRTLQLFDHCQGGTCQRK